MKTLTRLDPRYSVALEFNGTGPRRVWVARFCGHYLGSSPVKVDALGMARNHRRAFLARLAA